MIINRKAALAALLALAACNNAPNKDFEQQMRDRDVAKSGDRYAALESSMPKQLNLTYRKPDQYRDYSEGQSGTFRATYDSLLNTLDADPTVDRAGEPFKACRATFAEASAYQSDRSGDAASAAGARDKILAALRTCRAQAKKAGKDGANLARFASAGVILIGTKTVGQGDRDRGLAIWREGETLMTEDQPGFQLNAKSLRGY